MIECCDAEVCKMKIRQIKSSALIRKVYYMLTDIPNTFVPATRDKARPYISLFRRLTTSTLKVEKVVNDPQKPVPNKSMCRVESTLLSTEWKYWRDDPSIKDPTLFIPRVVRDDSPCSELALVSCHRSRAPPVAPAATAVASINIICPWTELG